MGTGEKVSTERLWMKIRIWDGVDQCSEVRLRLDVWAEDTSEVKELPE